MMVWGLVVVPAKGDLCITRHSGESRNPEWLGTSMVSDANGLQSTDPPSYAKVFEGGNLEGKAHRFQPTQQ